MRVLALDVGDRRIGVAIGDDDTRSAVPLQTLTRRGGDTDRRAIADLLRQAGATVVVVGLPLGAAGEEGPQARRTREFAERLAAFLGRSVEIVDESYSTQAAAARAWEHGAPREHGARRRADRDSGAAAVILQRYLDRSSGGPR